MCMHFPAKPHLLALLVLSGQPADAQTAPTADEALQLSYDLRSRMEVLYAEGRLSEALPLSDSLDAIVSAAPSIPAEVRWKKERVSSAIRAGARLSPDAQHELAEVERLASELERQADLGNRPRMEEVASQQIEIVRRHLGEQSLEMVHRLRLLGDFREGLGDHAAGENAYRQALKIAGSLLGGCAPIVGRLQIDLAYCLLAQGHYDAAESQAREALAVCMESMGEDDYWTTDAFVCLSLIMIEQGRYEEAEILLGESLRIRARHPIWDGRIEESEHNLAFLHILQGDDRRAAPILRELLEIRRTRWPEGHISIAANLGLLAAVSEQMGRLSDAEQLARDALDMWTKLVGEEHLEVAKSCGVLAGILVQRDKPEEATKLFEAAVETAEGCVGPDHPHLARFLERLAEHYWQQDRNSDAERCCRRALQIHAETRGRGNWASARALEVLGRCLLARGEWFEAERNLAEAVACLELSRTRAGTDAAASIRLASTCRALAIARLKLGRWEEAWEATEVSLARTLSDLLVASGQRRLEPEEFAREDSLRRSIARLEERLEVLERLPQAFSAGDGRAVHHETRDSLLAAEIARANLIKELQAKHPITGGAFKLERVQAGLDDTTAILGWIEEETSPGNWAGWSYVVRRTGPVRWAQLDAARLERRWRAVDNSAWIFREALAGAASWPVRVGEFTELSVIAAELYDLWLAPAQPHLQGVTHLVILPAGSMLGLPLEALVGPRGDYVGDTYCVSYAPSATSYAWLSEQASDRKPVLRRRALLVGDPALPSERAAAESASPAWIGMTQVTPLAWAGREIEKLAAVIPGSTVLLREEASEQTLMRLARSGDLAAFNTLHFAAHTIVDDQQPGTSALVLSQVDLPDPVAAVVAGDRVYDGFLTVKEILREWDLDADLVALSACRTGVDRQLPRKGYMSLAGALLQVGARSLLVSLWAVDDEATSLLMSRFYENLCGYRETGTTVGHPPMAKAEALREAKRWLSRLSGPDDGRPFAHPAYWSGFILMGEP